MPIGNWGAGFNKQQPKNSQRQPIFNWSPNLGGSTEEQYIRNAYYNAGNFANQLADFSSPFYTAYSNYLNKSTPQIGTGSFLSLLQTSGGNYGGSMAQTLQLKKNADAQRRDYIGNNLSGFASQNVGQIGNLLGLQGDLSTSAYGTKTQKEIAEMQQGGPLDIAGSILGGVGGFLLGGPLGSVAGASIGSNMFGGSGSIANQPTTWQGQGQNWNPITQSYYNK